MNHCTKCFGISWLYSILVLGAATLAAENLSNPGHGSVSEDPDDIKAATLSASKNKPHVIFPVAEYEWRIAIAGGGGGNIKNDPSKVVIGTIKAHTACGDGQGGSGLYDIKVRETLVGDDSEKLICDVFSEKFVSEGALQIFALAPNTENTGYELCYQSNEADRDAELALATARLDYQVLAADYIVIASETVVGEEYQLEYSHVRMLDASLPTPVERFNILGMSRCCSDDGILKLQTKPMIYFLRGGCISNDGIPQFTCTMVLPESMADEVRHSLSRSELYPIRDASKEEAAEFEGRPCRVREVTFQGSTADAIRLMGSSNKAAIVLLARTLWLRKNEALPAVAKEVEAELFQFKSTDPLAFRRLHNLIRWLAAVGEARPDGVLGRLTERYLTWLATKPKPPPAWENHAWKWNEADMAEMEQENPRNNHGLSWLLCYMDPSDAARRYGPRLLKLRENAGRGWGKEIQLAIDTIKAEDILDLAPALERAKALPVRHLDFPSDKKQSQGTETCDVMVSPTGESLILVTGDAREARIYDLNPLKLATTSNILVPQGHAMRKLSPNGRLVICGDGMEDGLGDKDAPATLKVAEAGTGRIVSSVTLPHPPKDLLWIDSTHFLATTLLHGEGPQAVLTLYMFDALDGKQSWTSTIEIKLAWDIFCILVSAGTEKAVYVCIWAGGMRAPSIIPTFWRIDVDNGRCKELGTIPDPGPEWTDGHYGVVSGQRYLYWSNCEGILIYNARTLKPISRKLFGESVGSVCFSADGTRYATAGRPLMSLFFHDVDYWRSFWMEQRGDDKTNAVQQAFNGIIRVRESVTGKTLFAFSVNDEGKPFFTPNGDHLIFVGGKGITIWTLSGRKDQPKANTN